MRIHSKSLGKEHVGRWGCGPNQNSILESSVTLEKGCEQDGIEMHTSPAVVLVRNELFNLGLFSDRWTDAGRFQRHLAGHLNDRTRCYLG